MSVTVQYLKSIGTSKKSIAEFKKWNKPKKSLKKKKRKNVKKRDEEEKSVIIESNGEALISAVLIEQDIEYDKEKSFSGLVSKKGGRLRFDFYLPAYNCLIEYDGIHHFKKVSYSRNLKNVQINDKIKDAWANRNKVPLLRVNASHLRQLKEIILLFLDKNAANA